METGEIAMPIKSAETWITTRRLVAALKWYLGAAGLVGVTAALRWFAEPTLGELSRFLPFVLPIAVSTYGGGVGPGIFTTALSVVVGVSLFVSDPLLSPAGRNDLVNILLFLVQAGSVIFVTAALRRARDEARAAAARAEAAVRQKDHFITRVSHEWRAPANTIAGWVAQLRERPSDVQFVRRAAASLSRAVDLQMRIVTDLLDYARGSRGKLSIHPVRVALRSPMDAAIEAVREHASEKRVELVVDFDDPGVRVWGDAQRLQQIFTNLLGNGVKFTPAGGRVGVHVSRVDDRVSIQIADNGLGIVPRALPRVFEPFEQSEPSRDAVLGGLGLGLAITRELVLLHGGTIEAASEGAGRGSIFTVRLPISTATAVEGRAT